MTQLLDSLWCKSPPWGGLVKTMNDHGLYSHTYISVFIFMLNCALIPWLVAKICVGPDEKMVAIDWHLLLMVAFYPMITIFSADIFRDTPMVVLFLIFLLVFKCFLSRPISQWRVRDLTAYALVALISCYLIYALRFYLAAALLAVVGPRYFNVFGPRQDPNGAYAAVILKWTDALLKGETVFINGDGETSRDFCFVPNAVQANLLAATAADEAKDQVYNVADGVSPATQPSYRNFRAGDVRHSQADIGKAQRLLGFAPSHRIQDGIGVAMPWFVDHSKKYQTI